MSNTKETFLDIKNNLINEISFKDLFNQKYTTSFTSYTIKDIKEANNIEDLFNAYMININIYDPKEAFKETVKLVICM